ncbi:MAG: hypothetical protein RL347_2246 [Actinomycetota bacterium]
MKYLVDVNVVVAVLRSDSDLHAAARAWFLGTAGRAVTIAALPETLAAAVRILTNTRIWSQTPTVVEATESVAALVDGAQMTVVGSSPGAWMQFQAIVVSREVAHRDVPDVLLAAQARAMDAQLVTFDRAFGDYPGLDVEVL